MRMSRQETERSRARIVASASRIARASGVAGTGVAEVMNDAGLTHGGFYRHFATKDALMAAALESAFEDFIELVRDLDAPDGDRSSVLSRFKALYLSERHLEAPESGCPMAALAGDIGRSTPELKARFGAGVDGILGAMVVDAPTDSRDQARAEAARQLAMMAGAVMIARASDPQIASEVLEACRARSVETL